MRFLYPAAATLVALSIFAPSQAIAQGSSGLAITSYTYVGEKESTPTKWFITYRATLLNNGPARSGLTATVSSLVSSASVVPGQGTLHFPPVGPNGQVASTDTFTLLVDRTQPFTFADLRWSFQVPIANPGLNQTVKVGSTVHLDGSASTNPSGSGGLTYSWAFASLPAGSNAVLQNATTVTPSFVVDITGNYVVTLTVNNGSATDSANVILSTIKSPPVAIAGPNQTVTAGATVTLDGSGSYDVDGNPLTYLWSLVNAPSSSAASLSNPTSIMPTFVADKPGSYVIQLVVNDGKSNSTASTVTITTGNTPPVANAGVDQSIKVGSLVQLTGASSTDVDGNALSYKWMLLSVPQNSAAVLSEPNAVNPTFTADVQGTYIAQLVVNDGLSDSAPSTVAIATNAILAPVANAGPNQTVVHGTTVTLSGSGTDPQALPLTFKWALLSRPANSFAALSSSSAQSPTFIADLPGAYVAQLIVSNGYLDSAPSTVTITTTNTPPVAVPGPNQTVGIGAVVTLDGSGSTDADHDPLTYSWSFLSKPQGSSAMLSSTSSVKPTFSTDLAGTYVVQLIVNDGFANSAPATVTITSSSLTIALTPNPLNLTVNNPGNLTVTLSQPAGSGGVTLKLLFDSTVISAPSSVTIPAHSSSGTVAITPLKAGSTTVQASGGGFHPGSATVNVSAPSVSVSLSSPGVGIARTITGTVTLSSAASVSTVVTLSAAPTGLITITPGTITIAAGSTTGNFSVTGLKTGSTTITASANGFANGSANVLIATLGAISLPSGITTGPGQSTPVALALSTPAPAGGVTVTLTSSDASKFTVPASVFIAQGLTAPAALPQITGVNFGSATLTASAVGYIGASQTIIVKASLSFLPKSATIPAGGSQDLTLNISSAPASALTITLASGNTAVATVPASVTIGAGATSVTVPVKAVAGGITNITASTSAVGVSGATANIVVTTVGSIALPAVTSVSLGQTLAFPITLSSPAPQGGVTVTLSSSDAGKVSVSPGTVTVAAGQTQPASQPSITGVGPGSATISASATGFGSASKTVQTTAALSFTSTTLSLTGTQSGTLTLTLSAAAPAGGLLVNLSATPTGIVTIPASVTIPAGMTSKTVTVSGLSSGTTTITAAAVSSTVSSATAKVTVTGANAITLPSGVALNLGQSVAFPVTLSSPAPAGGVTLTLTSTDSTKVALSVSSVTIAAGATQPALQPHVIGKNIGSASITASAPKYTSATESVQVTATIAFTPQNLALTARVTGNLTLNLSGPAPAGGLTFTVTSSDPTVATVSSSTYTIAAGTTKITVPVTGVKPGSVTIRASAPNFADATAPVVVQSAPSLSMTVSSASLTLQHSATVTLTLSSPAPFGGVSVSLSRTNPNNLSISPAVVVIPQGQTIGTAKITGTDVGSSTLSASAPGYLAATSITVQIGATISWVNPTLTLNGIGQTGQLGLKLSATVPQGGAGLTVTLTSSNPKVATVQSNGTFFWDGSNAPVLRVVVTSVGPGTTIIHASGVNIPGVDATVNVVGPLTLSTTSLPNALVGSAYSATLSAAGGQTPYKFSATGLPSTLSLNAATGEITGTPTTAGTSTVNVTVTDSSTPTAQTVRSSFTLVIKASAPASVTVASGTGQTANINAAFASPLKALVKDAGGHPLSGITVTFSAPTTGASGSFAGGNHTATTDATGVATSAVFTANGLVGSYNVNAAVAGVSAPAVFSLTNAHGAPTIGGASGSGQKAKILTAFAAPLVAIVKDSGGNPISGVVVTFNAPATGPGGTFAGGVNTAKTNAQGLATSAVFTANGTIGAYSVTATAPGATGTATFSLTNLIGSAHAIVVKSGSGQTAKISTAFGAPLVALVTDAGGNPVSGIVVTFTAPASGASGTFAGGVKTATTNAQGIATSAVFTANAAIGGYTVTASAPGVAGTAGFSLTNAPTVVSITATGGTPQSVAINTAFASKFVATVKTSSGIPVSGVVVTFNAPASGPSGSFAGGVNTATTNAQGVATSAVFTANSKAGAYTVTATVPNGSAPASFSLINLHGPAAAISATGGTPQSAQITKAFSSPLVATVTDAGGNPVPGVVVTFNAPASGASGTFAGGIRTATTNAQGVATSAVFTANLKIGSYSVTAAAPGVAGVANFALTNRTGPPAAIAVTTGSGQSAQILTAFAAPLVATVTDAGGNPVPGVVVTFTAPASGASGSFAGGVNTATTNAQGVATSQIFTANGSLGAYSVTASAAGVTTPAKFTLTNTTPPVGSIAIAGGSQQTAPVNTPFANPLKVLVLGAGNKPLSGVVVTFTAPSSGASGTFAGGVNTATTDASGVATSTIFTANKVAGQYSVIASAGGKSVPFVLTNQPGPAAAIVAAGPTQQGTQINTAFASPLKVTVTDAFGNAVSGATVTFAIQPVGGAGATFAGGVNTATTASNGTAASAIVTANSKVGTYTATATIGSGTSAHSVSFTLVNQPGPPASITVLGLPQSTPIGTAFPNPLKVLVTDAGGNPIRGVTVTFTPPSSGPSGTFAGGQNTAVTNGSGVATSAQFTANGTMGPYQVSAALTAYPKVPAALLSLTNGKCNNCGGAITVSNATIGQNLQAQITIKLKPAVPTGGVQFTIASSDPTKLLVGNSRASITPQIAGGTTSFSIEAEALASSGTADITVSAPGYATATSTITFARSGFVISGPSGIGGAFSVSEGTTTPLTVSAGPLDANGNFITSEQVRAGFSVSVPVTSSNAALGTVSPASAAFTGGNDTATVSFKASPASPGGLSVSVGTPAGFTAPSNGTSLSITVTKPTLTGFTATVGQGLEQDVNVSLGAPAPTAVDVTVTSSDPTKLKFSTNPSIAGLGSITVTIGANHAISSTFYAQSVGGTGSVAYTASSGNFGTVNGTVQLVPAALQITSPGGPGASSFILPTNNGSANLDIFTGYLAGASFVPQFVAGGSSASIAVVSSNTSAATVSSSPLTIPGGLGDQTTNLQPVAPGATLVTASATGFRSAQVNVQVKQITSHLLFSGGDTTIGQNLQSQFTVSFGQAMSSDVQVTVQSNSGGLLLSSTSGGGGAPSITVTIPAGSTAASFYVQGVANTGSATLTGSASGFTSATETVQLASSGFVILPTTINGNQGASATATIYTALLDANNTPSGTNESPITPTAVGVTSDNSSVASVPSTITVQPGSSTANVSIALGTAGTARISLAQPSGYAVPNEFTSTLVNVH